VNIETGPKLHEHGRRKTFGEDVGVLGRSGNVQDADFTEGDSFSNEVQVDLNMLGLLMLNRVGGEVNDADIIAVDHYSTTEWAAKLYQKLAQPAGFGDSIRDCSIFRLCTGPRHCRLTLG